MSKVRLELTYTGEAPVQRALAQLLEDLPADFELQAIVLGNTPPAVVNEETAIPLGAMQAEVLAQVPTDQPVRAVHLKQLLPHLSESQLRSTLYHLMEKGMLFKPRHAYYQRRA